MGITNSVKEVMTRDIVSVKTTDEVIAAIEVMTRNDIGSVVVMEDGNPVGILTARDILKKVCPERLCTRNITAGEIMSKPPIHIDAGAGVGQAGSLMTLKNVRRLLVVDKGEVVGIITQKDVMREALNTFSTLASM